MFRISIEILQSMLGENIQYPVGYYNYDHYTKYI